MSENIFWSIVWALAATCFCAIAGSVTLYNITIDRAIIESKDPVAAACAIYGNHTGGRCMAVVTRHDHK